MHSRNTAFSILDETRQRGQVKSSWLPWNNAKLRGPSKAWSIKDRSIASLQHGQFIGA